MEYNLRQVRVFHCHVGLFIEFFSGAIYTVRTPFTGILINSCQTIDYKYVSSDCSHNICKKIFFFLQGRPYIMNLYEESEEEMKETFGIPRWTDLIQCDTDL